MTYEPDAASNTDTPMVTATSAARCTDLVSASAGMARWRLQVIPERPLVANAHLGTMLRGALGHALRELACRCASPAHHTDCLYQQIFEPVPPNHGPTRFSSPPPAFVLTPPAMGLEARHGFEFRLTLLGPSIRHPSLVLAAFKHAGRQGLGAGKVGARIHLMAQESLPTPMPRPDGFAITFTSPVFLKHQGKPMAAERVQLADIVSALWRRLDLLRQLHGVHPSLPPLEQWLADSAPLDMTARLERAQFHRYSNKQKQKVPTEGLIGQLRVRGAVSPSLLQAFTLGQWLHIGGKTSLGLGAYQLHVPTRPRMHISMENTA